MQCLASPLACDVRTAPLHHLVDFHDPGPHTSSQIEHPPNVRRGGHASREQHADEDDV
jgi:hypothetical protein